MQYPRVITLPDGKTETLFSVQDFEYLIDRYMGVDALKYFRSVHEEYTEQASCREKAVGDLRGAVRSLNEKIAELESDWCDK